MKHFIIVVLVALATFAVMFAIYNPEMLQDIWLWIIGLIGPIIAFIKEAVKYFKDLFKRIETKLQE